MANQTALEFLSDLFVKVQIYLSRPSPQIQLLTIGTILLVVSLLSAAILSLINRRILSRTPRRESANRHGRRYQSFSFGRPFWLGLQQLVAPILSMITLEVGIAILLSFEQRVGLLNLLEVIFLYFLGYRLFVAILYVFFDESDVRRFHLRLFSPLFSLFVLYQVLSLFMNLNAAASVVVTSAYENPLTLGAIFLATVGLYFWVDGILGLNEIIFRLITRYTAVNSGRLEASLTLGAYVLVLVGVFVVLRSLGMSGTTFAAITGGLSIGIGFGLQEVLSNFVSGILILFEGKIRPGDYILVDGKWFWVEKLDIRSTHVKSWHGWDAIVPNQTFLNSTVTNFTLENNLYRLVIKVNIDHDSNHERAIEILWDMVKNEPRIFSECNNQIFMSNIDLDGKEIMLRVWIDVTQTWWDLIHDFRLKILDEFATHGIEIPSPRQDIRIVGELPWHDAPG